MTLSHGEVQELLGAYALDAVEGAEVDAIELHLRDCIRCRTEVETHRQTAALLSYSGEPAPAAVWDRIAGALDEAPPEGELARVVAMGPPRRPRPWLTRAVAGVAAALVVLLGLTAVRLHQRIDRMEDQAAFSATSARTVRLAAAGDDPVVAQAVLFSDGRGYLIAGELPDLPAALTYQLWGVIGDRTVSLGVLGSRPGVVPFTTDPDVGALAVTTEQRGGVAVSRNQPVVSGRVPTSA